MLAQIRRRLRQGLVVFTAITLPFTANAGLIRDAEIEHTLAVYAHPIFDSAGIAPESVRIFIVQDPAINAYVAGGLNLFINTGLIRAAPKPGMLLGVIAHETGHIAGAHLSQLSEKSTRATIGSILGAVLGAGMMAAGGHSGGQAGAGVLLGSQSMVERYFLGEIRLNVASADQAGMSFLDANDISAAGMLEMFETLRRMESGGGPRDPFLTDHPLTTDRIASIRHHLTESTIPTDQVPEGFAAMHTRMLAKLTAFMEPYATTLALYPPKDVSVAGRYARAIAEFRRSNLPEALKGMDSLIREHPSDPFFYDTRGQILFENGRVTEAAASYAKAASLAPDSALILTEYAKVLIAGNDPKELPHALLLLERSKDLDDSYDVTWRQFALAYGKQGKMGLSYEALAEEAALSGDWRTVLQHIARARQDTHADSSLALALDDLERDAKAQLKKRRDAESPF